MIAFWRNHLPYGMELRSTGEWHVFNREYKPLGVPIPGRKTSMLIHTKITEDHIVRVFDHKNIYRDKENRITCVFFYDDGNIPIKNDKTWDAFVIKLKEVANMHI